MLVICCRVLVILLAVVISTTTGVQAEDETQSRTKIIQTYLLGKDADSGQSNWKLETLKAVRDEVGYVPLSTVGSLEDSLPVFRASINYTPVEPKSVTDKSAYTTDLYFGHEDSVFIEAVVYFGSSPEKTRAGLKSALDIKRSRRKIFDSFEPTHPQVGLVSAIETAIGWIKPTDSTVVVAFLMDPVKRKGQSQVWCLAVYGGEVTYGPRGQEVGDGRFYCVNADTGSFFSLGAYTPLVRRVNRTDDMKQD